MQLSASRNPEKTDELVRISGDAVFHRDVFLPVVLPSSSAGMAEHSQRVPAAVQPGLPLDFDDE